MVDHDHEVATPADDARRLAEESPMVLDQIHEIDAVRKVEGFGPEPVQVRQSRLNHRSVHPGGSEKLEGKVSADDVAPNETDTLAFAAPEIDGLATRPGEQVGKHGMNVILVCGIVQNLFDPPLCDVIPRIAHGPSRSFDGYLASCPRNTTREEAEPMLIRRPVIVVALSGFISLVAAGGLIVISADWVTPTPIAGDPTLYADIAADILAGSIPYVDVAVEHLPMLLIPILFVGILADATSLAYAALWPIVTIGVVAATVAVAGRVGLIENYQRLFVLAVLPMLPLIIFRLEIYVVFAAVAAVAAFGASRYRSGSVWTLVGILSKGWPITLIGVPLRKGHRTLALGSAGIGSLLLIAVAMLPGFQEGRSFGGIHSETIVGNLILVFRHLSGSDPGLVRAAGAIYVEAPASAVVLNASIAVPVLVIAAVYLFRSSDTVRLVSIAGLMTAGVILMSPLFSAQFTFWLVPFVVLTTSRTRTTYLVAAALSTMVAAFWDPAEAWWAAEVLVRNVAFIALVVLWAIDLRSPSDMSDAASRPAENLA